MRLRFRFTDDLTYGDDGAEGPDVPVVVEHVPCEAFVGFHARCLVPLCDGTLNHTERESLCARFSTPAPPRHRRCVAQSRLVKRAWEPPPSATASAQPPCRSGGGGRPLLMRAWGRRRSVRPCSRGRRRRSSLPS